MSHTVTVEVELNNREALAKVVQGMGGQVLGEGTHHLYAGVETGFGFKLKGWNYPIVAKENGKLSYDDFNGRWGNPNDIERLKGDYALQVCADKCHQLGWFFEKDHNGLTVFHPDGGSIRIGRDGILDANNFIGNSCEAATAQLEEALGRTSLRAKKHEINQAEIRTQG